MAFVVPAIFRVEFVKICIILISFFLESVLRSAPFHKFLRFIESFKICIDFKILQIFFPEDCILCEI